MFNTVTENARNFRAAHPVAVNTLKSAWVVAVTASAIAVAADLANRVNTEDTITE